MSNKNMHIDNADYIKAMYSTASEYGYKIENMTETVADKANNVTTTYIIGYKATREDAQFFARVETGSTLASLQLAAKQLIKR